jgi:heme oxygenase
MKLIQKLREATKDQHAMLDQISEMKQLTSDSVETDDYKNYLLAFLTIYSTIEGGIYDYSAKYLEEIDSNQRLGHLKNDLKHFDVEHKSEEGSDKLDLSDKEYLGALYVMEGSRLGGSLIGKHLLNHLDLDKGNLEFLLSRPSVKWSKIISFLDEQPIENHVEIVSGAQKVFRYFYDELSDFYKRIK